MLPAISPLRIIAYRAHPAKPLLEPKDVGIAIRGWGWVTNSRDWGAS